MRTLPDRRTFGAVAVVPKGSAIYSEGPGRGERTIRKQRVAVVRGDREGESYLFLENAKGAEFWADRAATRIVDERNHILTVTRRNLGGHPIAGWNWPVWGFDYHCGCGEKLADREDYAIHLAGLAEADEQGGP